VIDDAPVVPARRISAPGLARLLGTWATRSPAYVALADAVRHALLAGTLPVGTRLPSERELADHLGLSRTTTTAAYGALRHQGYLASRRGAGSVLTLPTPSRSDHWQHQGPTSSWELDLSMTAPPLPAELPAAVTAALDLLPSHAHGISGYAMQGSPVLRAALAQRYTARGVPTTPEEILVTTGAQHALHLLFGVLCSPGDRVAVEHPTYPNAIGAVRERGARPVPVPMTPAGVDLDLLESTLRQSAPRVVYLVPDYHNPTGASLDEEGRRRAAELCRRHRAVLVADETLTDLRLDGPALPPMITSPQAARTVVCVGSASKSFWAGLRVGWVRAPKELVARLATARVTSDIATAVLDQLVLVRLLEQEEAVLARTRDELRGRRDRLLGLLAERTPSWRVEPPPGGMVLWVDLGERASTSLAALVERSGLRVAPGTKFSVDGSFDQYLRLTFSLADDDLERAVDLLADAWPAIAGTARGAQLTPVV
jgi:DNA-binding transcriptional MocR family regulator